MQVNILRQTLENLVTQDNFKVSAQQRDDRAHAPILP